MILVLGLIVAACLVANIWATVRLARAIEYSTEQKILQACIVWLLPFIGATVVLGMMLVDPTRKPPDPGYTEPNSHGRYDGVPPAAGPLDGLPH